MKKTLDNLYEHFLSMDNNSRIAYAKASVVVLLDHFVRECDLTKEEAVSVVFAMIRLFVSGDRAITQEELKLFNDIFGTEYIFARFAEIFHDRLTAEEISNLDDIIDNLNDDMKERACILGLAFLSSDKELSKEEKALFERILK